MKRFSAATLPSFEHPERNEDAYFINEKNLTAGVFDGLGGHMAGEVASQLAAKVINQELDKLKEVDKTDKIIEKIKKAFTKTNRTIKLEVPKNHQYLNMATTASVVKIIKDKLIAANVGDSRVYLKRKGKKLKQLTRDDSYVQELVDAGQITKEEATTHPFRNIVTQTLGVGYQSVKINTIKINQSDLVLICSDGVHDNLSDEDIEKSLPDIKNLVKIAYQISQGTSLRSKPDDITAVIIEI